MNIHPDAVPPIHTVSYHVATNNVPAQNGDKFRSIFSDSLQPIATRGKKARDTLLVDQYCRNGCSIKRASLCFSYYNEISGGHIGRGVVRTRCFAGPVLPLWQWCSSGIWGIFHLGNLLGMFWACSGGLCWGGEDFPVGYFFAEEMTSRMHVPRVVLGSSIASLFGLWLVPPWLTHRRTQLSTGFVWCWLSSSFLPRCIEYRRGLAMRIRSVCPSVKSVDCDKTEESSVQIFIQYERSFSLVFW